MNFISLIKNYDKYYWIPFIIFFIVIFIVHLRFPFIADDLYYYSGYPFENYNGFIDFVTLRTLRWTSRTLIESVLYGLFTLPYIVWRFLDSVIFTAIAIFIYKLFSNNEKKLIAAIASCFLTLLFFVTLIPGFKSAGYAATSVNYIWPLFILIIHFHLVKYILKHDLLSDFKKVIVYLIMILSLIFAINQEQIAALTFGIYFFTILYFIKNKIGVPKIFYINLLISILGLVYIFLNPGNHHRFEVQIGQFFPDYGQLTFYDKLSSSIFNILNYFVTCSEIYTLFIYYDWFNHPIWYRLLCIDTVTLYLLFVIGLISYRYNKSRLKTFISLVPFLISLIFVVLVITQNSFLIEIMVANVTRYGYHPSTTANFVISLAIYIIFIATFLYSLYNLYSSIKDSKKGKKLSLIVILLIFLGLCTTLPYGFTPTWVSLPRMYIYFYGCNFISGALLTAYLFKNWKNK